jgi:hypothetical protein
MFWNVFVFDQLIEASIFFTDFNLVLFIVITAPHQPPQCFTLGATRAPFWGVIHNMKSVSFFLPMVTMGYQQTALLAIMEAILAKNQEPSIPSWNCKHHQPQQMQSFSFILSFTCGGPLKVCSL